MAEVVEIWRYPVKSMAGERLQSVSVTEAGLEGDRRFALIDGAPNRAGKKLTARDVDALLSYRSAIKSGDVLVANRAGVEQDIASDQFMAELQSVAGRQLRLHEHPGGNFDDSPVLVVNLATIRALEAWTEMPVDHRRFRANLYLDGLEADAERHWLGKEICIGTLVLEPVKPCERCVMITFDPDSEERWPELLRTLTDTHATEMGVYCRVAKPGIVSVGDRLVLGGC
jgi:uncharacterized protein YcbX